MLHSVKALRGCAVAAMDGAAGSVRDLYIDDEKWTICYFVVRTGPWYARRDVLVLPYSVTSAEWQNRILRVWLTRKQVGGRPGLETVKPALPQEERAFYKHFGYPSSWTGHYPWRLAVYPTVVAPKPAAAEDLQTQPSALRLHGANAMLGHTVRADGAAVGRIEDFLFDDEDWSTRLMVAELRNRTPRKHVLISTKRIESINAEDRMVNVIITRKQLENSPEYDVLHPPQREQLQATQLLLNLFK